MEPRRDVPKVVAYVRMGGDDAERNQVLVLGDAMIWSGEIKQWGWGWGDCLDYPITYADGYPRDFREVCKSDPWSRWFIAHADVPCELSKSRWPSWYGECIDLPGWRGRRR